MTKGQKALSEALHNAQVAYAELIEKWVALENDGDNTAAEICDRLSQSNPFPFLNGGNLEETGFLRFCKEMQDALAAL